MSHRHTFGVPPPAFLRQEKERSPLPQRARGPWHRESARAPPRPPPAPLPPPPGRAPAVPAAPSRPRRRSHTGTDSLTGFPFPPGGGGTARSAPAGCESACLGACVCGACVCVRERARESAPSSPGSRSFLLSSLPNDTDSKDLGSCFH